MLRLLPALAVALAAAVAPLAAQDATVVGTVRQADGDVVAYAIVDLVRAAGPDEPLRRVLSDERGEFVMASVKAGEYRLRAERIGQQTTTGAAFHLGAGERRVVALTVHARPVEVAPLVVEARHECIPIDELDPSTDIGRLWSEAVKGVRVQRAFLSGWRRTVDVKLTTHAGSDPVQVKTVTLPTPAEAAADDAAAGGFGESATHSMTLRMPDERLLVEPARLAGYCIEDQMLASDDGAVGVQFRPIAPGRERGLQAHGVVWLERSGFRLRSLRYRYTVGDATVGTGEWHYGNVAVPGSVLRLPTEGTLSVQPGTAGRSDMILSFDNWRDFERITR